MTVTSATAISCEPPEHGARWRIATFAVTVFLSAFLMFQVELISSKFLLPWFGGSASVWTTSMLVFQTLLFAGYAYAHAISARLRKLNQYRFHLMLLGSSVATLAVTSTLWPSPITPSASWKPVNAHYPVSSGRSAGRQRWAAVFRHVQYRASPAEVVYL